MWRLHGPEPKDAARPEQASCQCRLCSNGIAVDQAAWMRVWGERDCAHGCKCRLCELAYGRVSVDEIRDMEDCLLAGYSRRTIELARLYASAIAPGYVDPLQHDLLIYQIAEIGQTITNAAKSQRINAMGD